MKDPAMTDSDPVDGLRIGMRAVVRRRIEHGVTDALGELVAKDGDTVSIQTRSGLVVIDRAAVVAAKEVPPRPSRRGAAHLAVSMRDLERIMVAGWPPSERAELGGWLLRAAGGFTGRANSVLPLGDPGMTLPAAVDRCESWYDRRGLRRLFCLFGPTGFAVDDGPLGRELLARGYQPFNNTAVLTTATRALLPQTPHHSGAAVLLEPAPSQPWWDFWAAMDARGAQADGADEAGVAHSAARAVLTGSPDQLFASLEVGGAVIGVARGAFAHTWAGASALHVAADHRRRGVAGRLIGALGQASRERGIRSMYLQVAQGNSPARSLFEGLGFVAHHEYCYLGR